MTAEAQIEAAAVAEDVLKAAHQAMQAINAAPGPNGQLLAVVSAILAERERSALVADFHGEMSVNSEWSDDARGAAYYVCADVANAIRNPNFPLPNPSADLGKDLPF